MISFDDTDSDSTEVNLSTVGDHDDVVGDGTAERWETSSSDHYDSTRDVTSEEECSAESGEEESEEESGTESASVATPGEDDG